MIIINMVKQKMEKIENATDICEYTDHREAGEDEKGKIYIKENRYKKNLEVIIQKRNIEGWKLLNTQVHQIGVRESRIFLFWEREII